MGLNVDHLETNGPMALVDLPYELDMDDKERGLAVFKLHGTGGNGGQGGKFKNGGPVYVVYLHGEHEPEAVLRAFFEENRALLDRTDRRGLVQRIGGHGPEWRDAASDLLYGDAEFAAAYEGGGQR